MNRKQNSLMRFSRTERLAQLSEQEIVIERKKKEILAKIEAQKKKETEEALKKLESSKESKNNKLVFPKKSWSSSDFQKKKIKETLVEPVKESLTNAFCNDGSFLDQFKKLSESGLVSDSIDMQTQEKKSDESKKSHDVDEKNIKNQLNEKKKDDGYKDLKGNNGENHSLSQDNNILSPDKQLLNSGVLLHSPPSTLANMALQPQGFSKNPSFNDQGSVVSSNSTQPTLNQVSQFKSNNSQSISLHSSYSSRVKSVPQLSGKKSSSILESESGNESKNTKLNQNLSIASLASIQPPLPIPPQNIPPPSPIQVQNIPPPPMPSKNNELPKYRTEGIMLSLKPSTTKKLEMIPNPLEIDQPPSPQKSSFSFSEKRGTQILSKNSMSTTMVSENASSSKGSLVSSAFYDDNEDEDVEFEKWAQIVARCGDEFEDSLRNRHQSDPSLRFLCEKNSKEYLLYRKLVMKYRRSQNFSEGESSPKIHKKAFDEESKDTMLINDEENLPEKRTSEKDRVDQRLLKTGETFDLCESRESQKKNIQACNKESPFEISPQELSSSKDINLNESKVDTESAKTEEKRKRKRKSRWGGVATTSTSGVLGSVQHTGNLPQPKSTLLSQLTRSDPGLIQYARQTFGSTNLSEEDWKKAEDHYKINLLYQDMVKKRAEVEKLEKQGKFKYEYDSDEDTEGGTWEHKLRQQEMQATQLWAEELTRQAAGKHHIGDFLPPEELERFMEKYSAVKEGREPDLSDYKEYKLKEDNVGYRLLQKMGWNEGQGLGQDGTGIQNPVNKATTRHENQGLGVERPDGLEAGDDEYDAYRKRMMLAYRFRPNPLNNPRRPYY